ncbi:hypothetical protein HanRHA438_Chr09g0418891 [Helianthus annuus]|nr:hypothetical protein HanRHA438_Chr09g0418891 [Helianthus annuus]
MRPANFYVNGVLERCQKKLTWTNTKVPRGRNFKIEKVPLMKSYDGVLKET